jgi:hypothetical protein
MSRSGPGTPSWQYRVDNQTNVTVWWRDQAWYSGDVGPGRLRQVNSDHDADVTIFYKDEQGRDIEYRRITIKRGTRLVLKCLNGAWGQVFTFAVPQRPRLCD